MMKEKKLKNSIESVSISCTKTILEQMMNCICNIKLKGSTGTGFFCKIPKGYGNNETLDCLLTNYHNIDEKYLNENNEISLLLKDNTEPKFIDLLQKREKYYNKDYDITIIEILKSDKIKKFLELDENIFKENNKISYEDESIYILQHQKGKNASVSYGLLLSIDNFDIKHSCNTDFGSSGSPILNLSNNKVIGIHKEGSSNFNFNKGTFLKFPLNDFLLKLNMKKSDAHKDLISINNSIESNENYEYDYYKEGKKLTNIMISLLEIEGKLNDEVIEIYDELKSDNKNDYKVNRYRYLTTQFNNVINKIIILSTYIQNSSYEINKYKKVLIKQYKLTSIIFNLIKEIPEDLDQKSVLISSIGKIKNFIEEEINRIENLSNSNKSKMTFLFKLNNAYKIKLLVDHGTSVDNVIKRFFISTGKPDLISSKEIFFFYHASIIKIGDKTKIEDYFKIPGVGCVVITVVDSPNLIPSYY